MSVTSKHLPNFKSQRGSLNLSAVVVSLIFALGLFWFYKGPSSEEKVLIQKLEIMEENIEFEEQLGLAAFSMRLNNLREIFMNDVFIEAQDGEQKFNSMGWQVIKENSLLGSRLFSSLALEVSIEDVKVEGSAGTLMAEVVGEGLDSQEDPYREKIGLTVEFTKKEGEWYVQGLSGERLTPR